MTERIRFGTLTLIGVLCLLIAGALVWLGSPPSASARPAATDAASSPTQPLDLGDNTFHVDPALLADLDKHARQQTVPATLEVQFVTDPAMASTQQESTTLSDDIAARNGTAVANATGAWTMPTGSILPIIQRSDVHKAYLHPRTAAATAGALSSELAQIASAISGGSSPQTASQFAIFADVSAGAVMTHIKADTSSVAGRVRRWLEHADRDVHVPSATDLPLLDNTELMVLLPAQHINSLSDAFPTVTLESVPLSAYPLSMNRNRWEQGTRDWVTSVIAQAKPQTTTAPIAGPSDSSRRRPSGAPTERHKDLDKKLRLHNATRWSAAGARGSGVKVGIIDWSFSDLYRNSALPPIVTLEDANASLTDNITATHVNAYCQEVRDSIVPYATFTMLRSKPCDSRAKFGLQGVDHGANVAELIRDMAPEATLYYAQANSPEQVYKAAEWLTHSSRDVDVIVHASGWHYDGLGDGESELDIAGRPTGPDREADNHEARYRYYPSPLETVKRFATAAGPIWINAAGNQQRWTVTKKLRLSNIHRSATDDTDYRGQILWHSSGNIKDRTCQEIPLRRAHLYRTTMRWADATTNVAHNVSFKIEHNFPFNQTRILTDSTLGQQMVGHPYHRMSNISVWGYDGCLRITVHPPNDTATSWPVPAWVQFQVMVVPDWENPFPQWAPNTISGRSIVNPAESAHPGLLAIGAEDMTTTAYDIMPYSSRGPMLTRNVTFGSHQERVKPDLAAGSNAATYLKWIKKCRNYSLCSDRFMRGTTVATSHMGGLAALMVEASKRFGVTPTAQGLAAAMKRAANSSRGSAAAGFGNGYMELPCYSEKFGTLADDSTFLISRTKQWTRDDCNSLIDTSTLTRKSDYHSFEITDPSYIIVAAASSGHTPQVYMMNGSYATDPVVTALSSSNASGLATKTFYVGRGIYTMEATTNASNFGGGDYIVAVIRRGTNPSASSHGKSASFEEGGTTKFPVHLSGLTSGTNYTVKVSSSASNRIGFNRTCTQSNATTTVRATGTAATALFDMYSCSTSSSTRADDSTTTSRNTSTSNIRVELFAGSTTSGKRLDHQRYTVSPSRPATPPPPALTRPPAPGSVSASPAGMTSINVRWNNVAGVSKYRVQYRQGSSGSWTTATSNATGTSYRVSGLLCGTSYQFRVSTYGNGSTYLSQWGGSATTSGTSTSACTRPVFGASSYSFTVPENANPGNVFGMVTATDPDGDDTKVRYRIIGGNQSDKFVVTARAGYMGVRDGFRYGDSSNYTLLVEATDEDNETSTVAVNVRALLMTPMFAKTSYAFDTPRTMSVNATIGKVLAQDPDGNDNQLRYSITNGNSAGKFAINASSGTIMLAQAIGDGGPDSYNLTVQVRDATSRTATVPVRMRVVQHLGVRFSFQAVTLDEKANPVAKKGRITLSVNEVDRTVTIPLSVEYLGGATAADFSGIPSSVTIPEGSAAIADFWVSAVNDTHRNEGGERAKITFGNLPEGLEKQEHFHHAVVFSIRDDEPHTEQVLWSSTLTVGDYGGYYGIFAPDPSEPDARVAGQLSDDDFQYDGLGYTVEDIIFPPYYEHLAFQMNFWPDAEDLDRMTLRLDGLALPFADRNERMLGKEVQWDNVNTGWRIGQRVAVSITYRR